MTLWSWKGSSRIEISLPRLRSLLMLSPATLFGSNCFVAQQPTSVTSDFPSECPKIVQIRVSAQLVCCFGGLAYNTFSLCNTSDIVRSRADSTGLGSNQTLEVGFAASMDRAFRTAQSQNSVKKRWFLQRIPYPGSLCGISRAG